MITFVTLLSIAVSMVALLWLSHVDPKRRSAFRLPPYTGARRTKLAWTIALLPGLFVIPLAGGPGFVLWLGALTVVGWAAIAVPPGRGGAVALALDRFFARILGRFDALTRRARRALPAVRSRFPARVGTGSGAVPLAARVAELEQKVISLESELTRLRLDLGGDALSRLDTPGVRVA